MFLLLMKSVLKRGIKGSLPQLPTSVFYLMGRKLKRRHKILATIGLLSAQLKIFLPHCPLEIYLKSPVLSSNIFTT
jgi:hypothetical protein